MNRKERLKEGIDATKKVCLVLVILVALKGIVGVFTNATVLIADALHSFIDLVGIASAFFGLKLASKKPDERFPYGYYKAESLAALFISFLIMYGAIELAREGIRRIFTMPTIHYPFIALLVAFVSAVVSLFISRYESSIAGKINSQAMSASAQEAMMDVISSALVFLAIFLAWIRVPYAESLVTIFVALIILKIALENIKSSVFALMDVSPDKKLEERIRELINSTSGIEELRDLKLRRAGPFIFGEATISVRKHLDVDRAHRIADIIEKKVKAETPQLESILIHVEPHKPEIQTIVVPVEEHKELKSRVSDHFGRAKYFMVVVVDKKSKKIISHECIENPYRHKKIRAGLSAVRYILQKKKIDAIVTKEIGEISFHTLRDNLVDVYQTKGNTAKDVIFNFIDEKLELLDKPTKIKE